MTYRNDHDAALARVDALEQENARLARDNTRLAFENNQLRTAPRVQAPPRAVSATRKVIPLRYATRVATPIPERSSAFADLGAIAFVVILFALAMLTCAST